MDGHRVTFASQAPGDCPSDAPGRARDEGGLRKGRHAAPALWSEARVGERRDARLEIGKPGDEPGMALAPASLEAQIEVAKRASKRDVADVMPSWQGGVRGLEEGQGAVDLTGLVIEPRRLVPLFGAPARLVDTQDGGVQH